MIIEIAPQFHASAIRLPQQWEWDIMRRYADTAVKSRLVGTDKNPVNTDQALFIILKGYELGITPLQSLAEIHLINGKPALSVQLMIGLANRSGMLSTLDMPNAREAFAAKEATVTGIRRDRLDSPVTMTFTMDDAKAAGLMGNPTWGKYPGQMLVNRAMSMVLRRLIPEALSGMYLAEELEDTGREPWIEDPQLSDSPQAPQLPSPQKPEWGDALRQLLTVRVGTQNVTRAISHVWNLFKAKVIPFDAPIDDVLNEALSIFTSDELLEDDIAIAYFEAQGKR